MTGNDVQAGDPARTRFGEHGILRPEGVLGPDMRGIRIDILIAVGMALDAGCSEDAEVRMRVDDAGCNPFAGAVDDAHAGRELDVRADSDDLAGGHKDGSPVDWKSNRMNSSH